MPNLFMNFIVKELSRSASMGGGRFLCGAPAPPFHLHGPESSVRNGLLTSTLQNFQTEL